MYVCSMDENNTGNTDTVHEKLSMEQLGRISTDEFKTIQKIPVIAVLENVRSAYNVGSVFRTADAFLLEGIYLCGYTAFPPHKEIKKTALGAEDTVHWKHYKNINDGIDELISNGYSVFAVEQAKNSLQLQNTISYCRQHTIEKIAVIFGNEVTGVEQATISRCKSCIEIPQLGTKHSLNIATAAGVVLWELVKPFMAATNSNN